MRQVLVCQYTNCLANGSAEVLQAFQQQAEAIATVVDCGCQGQCNMGPTVRVLPDEIWYCRVKPDDVPEIVQRHLQHGEVVDRLLHPRLHPNYL
ncbi:(2Fe-2S) ferredoxin domain-containing protein [Leptolyngbya sp. FACHB-36]|uniref:(2Fe-2S) ferredoxin domain-containing protein n=1 Tax=Leptolyngbya sp. FACHB-36 TaxID=2692808 RepID=UPI001680858D|nr:(2Fe-2S) ferredoxin domain-containing protein [Leptolyngbya sp. FACHB-36]MBD2021089.1 (2Fe-2S) ferredoxin domain-containing protein [Leptolyngbya sp. FACHB-36]